MVKTFFVFIIVRAGTIALSLNAKLRCCLKKPVFWVKMRP